MKHCSLSMSRALLFVLVGVILTFSCQLALASDVPTGGGCDNFPHTWGDNISCEGKFTLSDMGQFVDGVWQWDSDFAGLVGTYNFSPWSPADGWDVITPHPNTEIVIDYGRFDNKRYANAEPNHRLGGMAGYTNGTMVPVIWKSRVDEPTGENSWTSHFTSYPYYITHIDMLLVPQCQDLCYDWGCEFDSDPVTLPDGYICSWNDDGTYPLFENAMFEVEGEERLTTANVENVELNGQFATPEYDGTGTFYAMSYNTDNNSQDGNYVGPDDGIYFNHIPGLIPMGNHTAILHMKDGRTKDLPFEVMSDRVMPTVAATIINTVGVDKWTKSGKHIVNTHDVITNNITARELDGQLIIQWAEPDGAFQAPLPDTGGIRLKIWVGNPNAFNGHFLWIDAPVMSGTVVVPADKWIMIQNLMIDYGRTTVEIGGMYREQFNVSPIGFHNRGYFEGIEYTF